MSRIVIQPENLRKTAAVIKEVGLQYLRVMKVLELRANDFPQMDVNYSARIRPELEAIVEDLARLVLFHDPDIAAMRMAADIIENDEARHWMTAVGATVDALDAAYSVVDEVYDTAARYGMTLDEAVAYLGSGKITRDLVRLLGEEGTVSPGVMKGLTTAAGVGLDFLEEYALSDGSLWEATQRTLVSSGTAMIVAGAVARGCGRIFKAPIIGGTCLILGGMLGEGLGDEINRKIFEGGELTPEEKERLRAMQSPSGLTPEEEQRRADEAREGVLEARQMYVEEAMAEGMTREEAEMLAESLYPDSLYEMSY